MSTLRKPQNFQRPYDVTSLITHLQGVTTTLCACFIATSAVDGSVVAMTSYSSDLTGVPGYPGVTFKRNTGVSASQLQSDSGNAFSQMEASLFLLAAGITEADVLAGKWAHAAAVLFICNYEALNMGQLIMQSGYLAEFVQKGLIVTAEIKGLNNALTAQIGTVTRPECSHDFCDIGCGLSEVDYTITGTITGVTSQTSFIDSGIALPAGWLNNGRIVFIQATFGAVAFWKMAEATGASRLDATGRGNTLTDHNSSVQVAGKIGNGVSFNGTNQYLSRATSADIEFGEINWTVSFWVYPTQGTNFFFGKGSEYDFISTGAAGGVFDFTVYDDNGDPGLSFAYSTPFTLNAWHHVVIWRDVGAGRGYMQVDNGTVESDTWSGTVAVASNSPLQFGTNGSTYYPFRLDAVGFFKRILSAPERAALWNAGAGAEYPFTAANSGYVLRIDNNDTATQFKLRTPAPYLPVIGDTYRAVAGCQKRLVDCQTRRKNDGVTIVNNIQARLAVDYSPTLESFSRLPVTLAV